jgi:hypothetical protein
MIPESPSVRGIVQHMPTHTSVVPPVVHARDHTHATCAAIALWGIAGASVRTRLVSRVQERVDKLMSIAGARLDALRTDGVIGTGKRTGAKRAVSEWAHVPRHGQQAHCPASVPSLRMISRCWWMLAGNGWAYPRAPAVNG